MAPAATARGLTGGVATDDNRAGTTDDQDTGALPAEGAKVALFVEGPTPDWALPVPTG